MDRRVTPPKWVTSPLWGPPPPCKQALNGSMNKDYTVKFQKLAPPCMSPSKYKPPKPVMQKTLR